MRPIPGLVADTLHSSVVDGPGSRFVVFLQGCNFNCLNCHNPHTINRCDSCGICLDVCTPGALDLVGGMVVFDPDRCDGCDRCIAVCPTDSSPMARRRTVEDLLEELRGVSPFVSGVTVSGGEPTLQLDFLAGFFAAIKQDPALGGFTTFVDSNGSLPVDGWRRLGDLLDGAMLDLKAGTGSTHRAITGHDDEPVRASIRHLAADGRLHEVRLLVIEGLTDMPAELDAYGRFLISVDPGVRLRLLAFRHDGVRPRGRAWPETSAGAMERAAAVLVDAGLEQVIVTG